VTHINLRRDFAANWVAANPILHLGELGWERDTLKAKLGDGVTAWNDLDYAIENPDLSGYAPLASPVFTGNPTAPTPATADNDTSIATTAFVKAQGYALAAGTAPLASPAFTGNPTAPTPVTADNDTSIATTAFVKAQGYAPLASPALTGNPTAPTPATADNDTSIATTAFVKAALADGDVPLTFLPLAAGWTGAVRYEKKTGIITVYFEASKVSWASNDPITSSPLPVGSRPASPGAYVAGSNAASDGTYRVAYISSAGAVVAGVGNTGSIFGTVTFIGH
jgi:hypothetical protein